MRFRDVELTFNVTENENEAALLGEGSEADKDNKRIFHYPYMTKTLGPFKLTVERGQFCPSEVVMMLG
jgi:ATP-binding cassette subfamily E protein 1